MSAGIDVRPRRVRRTAEDRALFRAAAGVVGRPILSSQSVFESAVSLANRSAFRRARFRRSATCSFSYSVSGLSDGREMLLALFSRLLMT